MPNTPRQFVARILFAVFLLRIYFCRVSVVRTRHNKSTHVNLGKLDAVLLHLMQRRVVSEIRMNNVEVDDIVPGRHPEIVLIPHGNYHPYLKSLNSTIHPVAAPCGEIQLLCFGILRPYKNFDEVIRAVISSPVALQVSLRVTGVSIDVNYTKVLRELANRSGGRVTLNAIRAEDEDLIGFIKSSSYVVVPYVELYNSGVVLLALSLDTPVVLRDSDAARDLLAEFGDAWVKLYTERFTPTVLESLKRAIRWDAPKSEHVIWPQARKWPSIGRETAQVYMWAIGRGPRGM